MIDIIKSEKAFKKYLENYDLDDDRIKLKVTHTYGVVDASQRLAQKLNLSKEDTDLSSEEDKKDILDMIDACPADAISLEEEKTEE